LITLLVALAGLQIVVHLVGRWTMPLAVSHAALQVAIAAPLVALALGGSLIDQRFAAQLGRPELARGDWPVMLILAAGVTLVTAWEIFDAFRRAHRTRTVAMATEA
jgi:hypothetical protein